MANIAKISEVFLSNDNSNNSSLKSNKFFDYIWPIERFELPKFLFTTLLMFCILSIQNLIRALKDSTVNTMIGAETISFLKFWGVMPAAFLIMIIYVKLVNSMKGENIFYLVMSIFLGFFALFAFYIYPNYETLHLSVEKTQNLVLAYPNFKWVILLISNWSFSLFYVIAELWPNVMFALLFWQFVNMITSVEESKRFYPLFGLLGQTGLYISGTFLNNIGNFNEYFIKRFNLNPSHDMFAVQIVLAIVVILGLIAIFAFWVLNHVVLDRSKTESLQFKIKKHHMTLIESVKMILSSKYIMLIATLLICYGIAINLVEGTWKASVAKTYTTQTEYLAFVGNYLSYTGLFTIIFTLLGSNIVRRLGWFSAAIITPIMVFVTGILFFVADNFEFVPILMGTIFVITDPSLIAITIGAIQNVLGKSSKYTFFDSTKEMSYVPLDDEIKTKGKAAADLVGTKLGKSASSLLQLLIFTIVPSATYQSISCYLMVVFTVICAIWIWAVRELSIEYTRAVDNKN